MKRPWDRVKLTVKWWHGTKPVEGDELHTTTGRRYLILSVKPKRFICLVLPKDAQVTEGTVFQWTWARREKRKI